MGKLRSSAVIVLFVAAGCFGQEPCNRYPLNPSTLPPCQSIAAQIWNSAQNFKNAEAQLNNSIVQARSRFWKVFPNGPGFEAAQTAFLAALRDKDISYLMFSLQQGVNGDVQKMMNAIEVTADPLGIDPSTPRDLNSRPKGVDAGIRPFAYPLYVQWVNALRRAQGRDKDGMWAQPQIVAEAYVDKSHWRRAYEDARNWAEFLSSGLDITKYVTPQVYLINQMESDVAFVLARSKPADLPEPKAASMDLYNFFVKTFGEKNVLAAATAVLHTPKNSIGGLAKRAEVVIGAYQPAPSPNPFLLFLTQVTNTPRNYAIALCMDQTTLLLGGHATETLNSKEQWAKAASVYGQLVARFGEPAVVAAAGRLKDVPKDDRGGPRGDPEAKGAIFWFTALLKDPKTPLPDMPQFLASSYDPRWLGKVVDVRGTVARVVLDTDGSPRYATIHFKESKNDRFTAFTPNSEILQSYGPNFSGLIGKPIEIGGQVRDWGEGSGIRFLISKELKVLDAGALANFRESAPDWMRVPLAADAFVDSPQYLTWKKFPPGSKARYEYDLLHEYQPGTNQYTKSKISTLTFTLESIDGERAIVKVESTVSGKMAGRNGPDTTSITQQIIKAKRPAAQNAPPNDPTFVKTTGEETLVINGKKIAASWECVTRAGDPLTFTKTWTSAEVPGGLVRIQQQTHAQVTDQTYRNIQQTILVSINGDEPQLGAATSSAPLPAGNAVEPNRGTTPASPTSLPARREMPATPAQPAPAAVRLPRGRPDASTASSASQAELMTHYGAIMRRASQDRLRLAQTERKRTGVGVPLPDEIRAAQERLNSEQQAVNLAMRARDYAAGQQRLGAMEDTLAVIEDFLKADIPVDRGNPRQR
jgi:hypothetical protein